MEREIKFRGLRTDGKGWVYGDLKKVSDYRRGGSWYYIYVDGKDIDEEGEEIQVYPYSLGQFTGLKDKNGVDIYEGDIDENGDVVSWCNNRNGWAMCVFEDSTFKNKAICHCYNCEGNFDIYEFSINVVSNIHE